MYIPRSIPLSAFLLSLPSHILANPLPDTPPIENLLVERCQYPCGWVGLCCQAAGACYTDTAGQAQCGSGSGGSVQQNAAGGQYQLFTTTYTDVFVTTSTGSYLLGGVIATATETVAVQSTAAAIVGGGSTYPACDSSIGESPCGPICCATGQTCQTQGQCVASGAQNLDFSSSYLASITVLASGTPAIRPTSNAVATVTATGTPTFTTSFSTPMPTSGGAASGMSSTTTNGGLSGGAIAGIVIGVLLGVALLLLICGCLCFKGILDSFLAFFGLGPRRRRRQTDVYEEEIYEGRRPPPRRWFGRSGPSRPKRKEKKSGGGLGGAFGVGAGLAGLAILLGLKRRRDKKDEKSSYTGSSYTYSDYTSESEYSVSSSESFAHGS